MGTIAASQNKPLFCRHYCAAVTAECDTALGTGTHDVKLAKQARVGPQMAPNVFIEAVSGPPVLGCSQLCGDGGTSEATRRLFPEGGLDTATSSTL